MRLPFANRLAEIGELDRAARAGGLVVVYGRRRVGKTRLLMHWLRGRGGLYSQAIEAAPELQLDQVVSDLGGQLQTAIVPKSWAELFELLRLQPRRRWVLCLDEFPYLTASDPSLPSILQRWLDHDLPRGALLILSGSSTRMMNDLFLNRSAALYGRARKLLHVAPMGYGAFCRALRLDPVSRESFVCFSLVGGVPKYWELIDARATPIELADELYFGFAPYMEQEPARILRDEGISGLNPLSVLEAVGRGATRPSEIAARLGTAQTNLSRLLQLLLDASILEREIPFGESSRSTKRSLYRIADPALRFWFRVYSPHRTRWRDYDTKEKAQLLDEHASTVFEDLCRREHPGAARYWEGEMEFDIVREQRQADGTNALVISEVKWQRLPQAEKERIGRRLRQAFERSKLAGRKESTLFEVLDASELRRLGAEIGAAGR